MLKVLAIASVAVPTGLLWAVRDVSRIAIVGAEHDRFSVPLLASEAALLTGAASIARRDRTQLFASAFYRSLSFAPERYLLAAVTRRVDSDAELLARQWSPGDCVSGAFEVRDKTAERIALGFRLGPPNRFLSVLEVRSNSLEFASHIQGIAMDTWHMKLATVFHLAYSRLLLAGAKHRLMRDAKRIVDRA